MDLFTIAGACVRRWYLTLPLLLVVGLLSFQAYAGVEPLYTSSRSVVVLPSLEKDAADALADEAPLPDDESNPYSGQGGSRFAVAVLARNINSAAFKERLGLPKGVEQTFEADSSENQPMIHVTATASSEQGVHSLLDRVVEESAVVLDEFQAEAGAPEVSRYRIAPAVPAGPVEDATPSRLRSAGAIMVLGGGLVAALVVGADALLARRRRRKEEAAATTSGDEARQPAGADETHEAECYEVDSVHAAPSDDPRPSTDDVADEGWNDHDVSDPESDRDRHRVSATSRD